MIRIRIDFGERPGKTSLAARLTRIVELLEGLQGMRESFDNLTAAVQAETTVVDSFIRYTTEITAKLEAALADDVPTAKVQAVIDDIRATTDRVSAAMVAGTVAEDEVPAPAPADPGANPSTPPSDPTPNPVDPSPPTPAPGDLPTFNSPPTEPPTS